MSATPEEPSRPYTRRGGLALPAGLADLSAKRRRGLLRLVVLLAAILAGGVALVALLGGGEPDDPNAIVYRDADDTNGPLDILSAQIDQQGPQLVLFLRTAGIWTPGQLAEEPGRSVCTTLWAEEGDGPRSRVCVVSRAGNPSLALQRYKDGRPRPAKPIAGQIRRRNLRLLEARFSFRDARLPLGKFRWQVATVWAGDPGGCPPVTTPLALCADKLPDEGSSPGKVTKPLLLGCTSPGPDFVQSGPRTQKVVALTFDDGPSEFTPQVLDILEGQRVPATFFVIGENVGGREEMLRRMLDRGSVLANHTYTHINTAGGGVEVARELDQTTAAIKRATNFTPCLFRPPYGSKSVRSISLARSKGLQTVNWDVDTGDYGRPASGNIAKRVLRGVRWGSIVLMHDGGGARDQTVQALPRIIRGLRARGFRFLTLHQLLGVRERYA
jgi:peptidoglycan/xylan/chitin deacetylase (PgdA/CDA1 family)